MAAPLRTSHQPSREQRTHALLGGVNDLLAGGGSQTITNAFSIDVEDYFQVQALSSAFPRAAWTSCESRVERNTNILLDLLAETKTQATFFTLGWIAERHPLLVQRIVAQGHELASHGYAHFRVDGQSPEQFRADVRKTKRILEDCGGTAVSGYRAATFSVNEKTAWAFPILEEEGYRYSSSVYPISSDNYAYPNAPRFPYHPTGTSDFKELPISTLRIAGRNLPCGGGGYFRLTPYSLFRFGLRQFIRRENMPIVFYIHPWELDPEQPRPPGISAKSRLRHYLNLHRTADRLRRLLTDFRWDRLDHVFARLDLGTTTTPVA